MLVVYSFSITTFTLLWIGIPVASILQSEALCIDCLIDVTVTHYVSMFVLNNTAGSRVYLSMSNWHNF